jgi:hypothetical protein
MARTEEDFESITGGALAVGEATDEFGTRLQKLQATVTTNNPWGRDEPGTVFGTIYSAVLGRAMQTYGSHRRLLASGAAKLADWAANSRAVEDVNAALARAFGPSPPSPPAARW